MIAAGKSEDKMMHKELPQVWWFGSRNLARPSPWLNNTLSGMASSPWHSPTDSTIAFPFEFIRKFLS